MGYNLDGDGLHIVLSSGVPSLIQRTLPAQVDALLAAHGLGRSRPEVVRHAPGRPEDPHRWSSKSWGLGPEQLAASWKVLRNYGNMSSAAVLFVLAEMLQNARRPSREIWAHRRLWAGRSAARSFWHAGRRDS